MTFNLLESAPVQVSVYDVLGRLQMHTLVTNLQAGSHEQVLNLQELPGGIYVVDIAGSSAHLLRKLVVNR